MVGLRIITRVTKKPSDPGQFRGVIQQGFEVFVVRPRTSIGMKAQREVAQSIAQNREFGEGGLFVLLRPRVAFHWLFRLILLRRLLPAFAEVVRGLTVLQTGRVQRRVLETLAQPLFFCASVTVDPSKDLAEESLSKRTDAFWIVV